MATTTTEKKAKAGQPKMTKATIDIPGSGYAVAPHVSFGRGGGSGARPAAASLSPREINRASALLKQVSDATRLQIVSMLDEHGSLNVGELCAALGTSQPAVSHHLALSRAAGIFDVRRQGKHNYYSLAEKGKVLAEVVRMMVAADRD